jgi:hypothetical protein
MTTAKTVTARLVTDQPDTLWGFEYEPTHCELD